jgi:hypothetical protein
VADLPADDQVAEWVGVFAEAMSRKDGVSTPNAGQSLAAYFGAHELRPAHLEAEQDCLQAGFRRRALAHRYSPAAARWVAAPGFSRPAAPAQEEREQGRAAAEQQRRLAAEQAAAAEQARFDAQYQARVQQQAERAVAERELEREAAKDDGWRSRERRTAAKEKSHRHLTDLPSRSRSPAAPDRAHETFALAAPLPCAELGRSELDLLGDLEVPILGFRANAHARRRAFFGRIPASSRPVSLARAA